VGATGPWRVGPSPNTETEFCAHLALQVTDARATMALYRLFKGEWESIVRRQTEAFTTRTKGPSMISKGKSAAGGGGDEDASEPASKKRKSEPEFPGGGRKNVSSGLSVIVRRNGVRIDPPGKARARRAGEVGSAASSAIGNAAASTGGVTDAAGNWWE
jgi:RNA exonuclease 4